jgi:hypothetical protein
VRLYKRCTKRSPEEGAYAKDPKLQSIITSCLSKTVQKPTAGGASHI